MSLGRSRNTDRFKERNGRHMYSADLRAFEETYIKNLQPTQNVGIKRLPGAGIQTSQLINQCFNMHCSAIPLGSVNLNACEVSLPSLQRYNGLSARGHTGRAPVTGRTRRRRERCPFANDADTKIAAMKKLGSNKSLPLLSGNTLNIGSEYEGGPESRLRLI
jgi:hypothetical protein